MEDFFKPVHPNPSRNDEYGSKAVTTGRHNESEASYQDKKYARCRQCGFLCNSLRDIYAPEGSRVGTGNTSTNSIRYGDNWGTCWGGRQYDLTVNSGCPLCGSYLWR